MKKYQLKVEFNEEKMKAIKVSLKEKNKDFDEELLKFLNGLYNKSVPKLLKKYIEAGLETEEKDNEDSEEIQKEEVKELNTQFKNSNETLENNNKTY